MLTSAQAASHRGCRGRSSVRAMGPEGRCRGGVESGEGGHQRTQWQTLGTDGHAPSLEGSASELQNAAGNEDPPGTDSKECHGQG